MAAAVMLSAAACAPAAPSLDAAADAVERYLTAKVNTDEAGVRALLCPAMEADLPREITSFSGVTGARIDGMDCTAAAGENADAATVTCAGTIVAEYGAEATEFPLRTYTAVLDDGEWKWCGETGG
jgi:hypothetical protein